MEVCRLGTRGSALARAQAAETARRLGDQGIETVECMIRTSGDMCSAANQNWTGKGDFCREIDEAQLRGEIDLAVHSGKDVPSRLPEGLEIVAVLPRESAHDVLIRPKDTEIPLERLVILTASVRRIRQWREVYPDARVETVRGNVDTRLNKLRARGPGHALLLAAAGLNRLKPDLSGLEIRPLSFEEMIPCGGQGAIVLVARQQDERARAWARLLDDPVSHVAVQAERAFLQSLGGHCHTPVGVHARPVGAAGIWRVSMVVYSEREDRAAGVRVEVELPQSALLRRMNELGAALRRYL